MFLEGEGVSLGGDAGWGVSNLSWRLSDEFGQVAVAEERDDGDETHRDGNEDGVPARSGSVEAIGNAEARIRGGEEIRKKMEGQSAESGAGEDGGPEEFGEEPFEFPKIGRIGRGDGANFGRGEFSELPRERPGDG